MADIKQYVKAAEEKMTFAIEYLDEQLSHIRAGKANPKILDCVRVMYYGAPVPLTNVATVTVPDARTIMITPWEKKIIKDIEKGIWIPQSVSLLKTMVKCSFGYSSSDGRTSSSVG